MAKTRTTTRRVRLNTQVMEDRLVPALDLSGVEFRTIDGTANNPNLPNQGAAEIQQIRFGYGDDFPDDIGNVIITTAGPTPAPSATWSTPRPATSSAAAT